MVDARVQGLKILLMRRLKRMETALQHMGFEWNTWKTQNEADEWFGVFLLKSHLTELEVMTCLLKLTKECLISWTENLTPFAPLSEDLLGMVMSLEERLRQSKLLYQKEIE